MAIIAQPSALWGQSANVSFFLAALFSDVLLIRIFLAFGFIFLLANALAMYPSAPDVYFNTSFPEYTVFLDSIIWCLITVPFHFFAIYRHLKDEMPVDLDEDDELLWRFFYRRSGMPRLEFREVRRRASQVSFKAGDTIVVSSDSLSYLHLLVEGCVEFVVDYNGVPGEPRVLRSGSLFDLEIANIFGVSIGFENEGFEAVAKTDCVLLRWSFEAVDEMANRCAPSVASYWRNMILYTVATELNHTHTGQSHVFVGASGHAEGARYENGERSRDFTEPLLEWEQPPKTTCKTIFSLLRNSINPFPPPGLRHTALPQSGYNAQIRLQTVRKAVEEARKGSIAVQPLDDNRPETTQRALRRAYSKASKKTKVSPEAEHKPDGSPQDDLVVRTMF